MLRLPLVVSAAAVGIEGVDVGVHYPLDVLAGAGLGAAVARVPHSRSGGERSDHVAPQESGDRGPHSCRASEVTHRAGGLAAEHQTEPPAIADVPLLLRASCASAAPGDHSSFSAPSSSAPNS